MAKVGDAGTNYSTFGTPQNIKDSNKAGAGRREVRAPEPRELNNIDTPGVGSGAVLV